MMNIAPADRYDRTTIILHWLFAFLIPLQWVGAHMIDWFPKGPVRVDVRSVHIVVGVLLAVALLGRIYWRSSHGTRLISPPGAAELLARFVHYLLYALIAAVLALGIFNAWIRGDDIFGLFHLPQYGAYDKEARHALSEQIVGWHALASNALLVLAGGHALIALIHQYVIKDGRLSRMLSGTC